MRQPQPKIAFEVTLHQIATGEDHTRLIFAQDEATARERAVVRARAALGKTMAEREYGKFKVIGSIRHRLR